MNIKAFLFDDDRGVSPVIGVILMVAITVILAAVIAAFVLGLGDTNSTAPSVTFDYEYTGGDVNPQNVTVTMTGGETFDPARVTFGGENLDSSNSTANSIGDGSSWSDAQTETVSAGDSIVVGTANNEFELDVIFTSEDGGTSSTIGGTTGPDA